jgi:hypothetical protein
MIKKNSVQTVIFMAMHLLTGCELHGSAEKFSGIHQNTYFLGEFVNILKIKL